MLTIVNASLSRENTSLHFYTCIFHNKEAVFTHWGKYPINLLSTEIQDPTSVSCSTNNEIFYCFKLWSSSAPSLYCCSYSKLLVKNAKIKQATNVRFRLHLVLIVQNPHWVHEPCKQASLLNRYTQSSNICSTFCSWQCVFNIQHQK